ncbi:RNA polymerase subunit sigma [Muribaculum intestinale]|uniref:RNA polymerase subunit sigma n=1 Tax=Muribaculum intestinale TaxID=1796646 RepID=UPI00242BE242|nr:RNA polymerase subunit sigma [Muribaculum intestinale]
MNTTVESRKTEIRYVTSDPAKMLGKWVARRALRTWTEDFVDEDTGKVESIERNEILLERGTYISQDVLCSIKFMMSEGSLKEVEVSNQNRQGMLLENRSLFPYKAVAKIDGKRKSFLLYANSVANALVILVDYIELHYKGGFEITDIKEMEYCVVIIDRLKSAEARRYELDAAYLKGEMSMEDFVEATCDNISKGNPDAEGKSDDKKETKKFYQIGAHVVLHDDKEGDIEEDHTFIVQTISAVRANMLIEKWLRDKQEERFRESLKHPERTFVKYQINSFIEESKIIPIGCFIPVSFSEVYNDRANDD